MMNFLPPFPTISFAISIRPAVQIFSVPSALISMPFSLSENLMRNHPLSSSTLHPSVTNSSAYSVSAIFDDIFLAMVSRCAGYLMTLMYYFLCRQTEPKSTMRALTIILALKVPFFLIVSIVTTSIYLIFFDAIFWVSEFIFLLQIHKGYKFGECYSTT